MVWTIQLTDVILDVCVRIIECTLLSFLNIECFMNLRVILVQGPCWLIFSVCSNFSLCAAEASMKCTSPVPTFTTRMTCWAVSGIPMSRHWHRTGKGSISNWEAHIFGSLLSLSFHLNIQWCSCVFYHVFNSTVWNCPILQWRPSPPLPEAGPEEESQSFHLSFRLFESKTAPSAKEGFQWTYMIIQKVIHN